MFIVIRSPARAGNSMQGTMHPHEWSVRICDFDRVRIKCSQLFVICYLLASRMQGLLRSRYSCCTGLAAARRLRSFGAGAGYASGRGTRAWVRELTVAMCIAHLTLGCAPGRLSLGLSSCRTHLGLRAACRIYAQRGGQASTDERRVAGDEGCTDCMVWLHSRSAK